MAQVNASRDLPSDSILLVNTDRAVDYLDRYQITLPAGLQFTTDFLTLQIFAAGPRKESRTVHGQSQTRSRDRDGRNRSTPRFPHVGAPVPVAEQ